MEWDRPYFDGGAKPITESVNQAVFVGVFLPIEIGKALSVSRDRFLSQAEKNKWPQLE